MGSIIRRANAIIKQLKLYWKCNSFIFLIIDWNFISKENEYIKKAMHYVHQGLQQNLPSVVGNHSEVDISRMAEFVCNDCGKCYNRKGNLGRHKRYECGKDKQFKCIVCPKSFFRKDKLCFHMKMCHQVWWL